MTHKLNNYTLILLLLVLCSCQKVELINRPIDNSTYQEIYEEFKESFNVEIKNSHTFNMAVNADVTVRSKYAPQKIEVYMYACNRWHKLTEALDPSTETRLVFDLPLDITDLAVVVNDRCYYTDINSEVNADAPGDPIPEGIYKANYLGWIVAFEVPRKSDYDFNDLVMRVVPKPDGSVDVTAMACGVNWDLWLHFCDDNNDYILTPYVEEGYVPSKILDAHTAYAYEFHGWFSQPGFTVASDNTVNTMNGYNYCVGRTVTLPSEVVAYTGMQMSTLSVSERTSNNAGQDYNRPVMNFYVTANEYEVRLMEDVDIPGQIICATQAGQVPNMLVFPDLSEEDTADRFVGWQWPTELSRIDVVYPEFIEWLKNPQHVWYEQKPNGWPDRTGSLDDYGYFRYFGYYPR